MSFASDYLIVLCRLAGVLDKEAFIRKVRPGIARRLMRDKGVTITTKIPEEFLQRASVQAAKNFERWIEDRKGWNPKTIEPLIAVLNQELGRQLSDLTTTRISAILSGVEAIGIPDFLALVRQKIEDVRDLLSAEAIAEWHNRYGTLSFFDQLERAYAKQAEATRVLGGAIGVYHLYRRHSTKLGIVREIVIVEKHVDMHCTGVYHHYVADSEPSIVAFHTYYCGYYTLSMGLHMGKGSCELVSVRLYNRYLPVERKAGEVSRYYGGMLSAVYDLSETLMAERVLMKKIREVPVRDASDTVQHILDGDELTRYQDFLNNADVTGRVFSCTFERLQMILARDVRL